MTPAATNDVRQKRGERLLGLDGLRGLAAASVLLFHFTTAFSKYGWLTGEPAFTVNLPSVGIFIFFMISGFVILITLQRHATPLDFAASRFARLYPAYLTCLAITLLCIEHFGPPVRSISLSALPANLLMCGQMMGQPLIDGSYWTLQRELMFYILAGCVFYVGGPAMITPAAMIWSLASIVSNVVAPEGRYTDNVDPIWIARALLNLQYAGFFSTGMMLYKIHRRESGSLDYAALACALLAAALVDGYPGAGVLALRLPKTAIYAAIVYLAARGRIPGLQCRPLLLLGAISYSLYLVHQTIGLYIIYGLRTLRVDPNVAILMATVIVVAIALLIYSYVERPGQRLLMAWYRQRRGLDRTIKARG
jgi:peptidoglycan/LPS O-acetylase OafA/YrhL